MRETKTSWKTVLSVNRRAARLWRSGAPGLYTAITLSAILNAAAPFVPLYFTAKLLEELVTTGNREQMVLWAVLLLASSTLVLLLSAICKRWYASKLRTMDYVEGELLFKKLLSLDFCVADESATHELLSQIKQNSNWSSWGLLRVPECYEKLLSGATKIICSVAMCITLFLLPVNAESKLAWLNTISVIIAVIAILIGTSLLSPYLRNKGEAYWSKIGEEVKQGNRSFGFYNFIATEERERAQDIRIYAQDGFFLSKIKSAIPMLITETCQTAHYARGPMGLLISGGEAVTRLANGLAYLFVCLKAAGGAFGVGLVSRYLGALTAFSGGISECLEAFGLMRNDVPYLDLVFQFMDLPNRMYQGSLTTEKRSDRNYDIEFRNVSFRYPGAEADALSHVSIKFRVGERLAVVGENGSGKTTFIKLLCRLYDPTEGQILLNGIDIRKYRYDDFLALFSVVFQDYKLLALPLGENVAANHRVDSEKVTACLNSVGFSERLAEMPDGLQTYLYKDYDENGVEVSGGEGQKIAIARALYKDAPFIVLDEPTASLDPIAEAEIYEKFNEIVGDKTAIYISHRLSSCKFCDEILVFDHGKIVQKGAHEDLVHQETGKYYALWNAQAQYYAANTQ